ncbi:hypothetical protein JD969_11590 [Planctomycetota bacterium]|nr:hypothetical protein JD969_11590 [Planctomycetota bacterium]
MNPFDLKLLTILIIAIAIYRFSRMIYNKYIATPIAPIDSSPKKSFSQGAAKRYVKKIPDLAYYAVRSAKKQFDINLDYSKDSIHRLDDLLDQINHHYHEGNIPQAELNTIIPYWAAYLGQTVIKTNSTLHLKWSFTPDKKNNPIYAIIIAENKTIHPFHIIEKRIVSKNHKPIYDVI